MELLNKSQVAEKLSISVVTLDRIRKSGKITFRLIGNRIRFLQKDIDAFIENSASGKKEEE